MGKKAKRFLLPAASIISIARGHGGCIASDMITVDGLKVGYMYREETTRHLDSGWVFLSGKETREYMDDASNHGIYDVNTIANYDPDIVPFLNSPPRSAFIRDSKTGKFVAIDFEPAEE